MTKNTTREPLIHLAKRGEVKAWQAWVLRVGVLVFSTVICAIITTILTGYSLDFFFKHFFDGLFGTDRQIWRFAHESAILLLLALAVTPCFKMHFWNIGGEGQALMGALGCAVIINFCGGVQADAITIILSILMSVAFGIVWAVIPAIFKALWNTNETLLTLMMNYIAVCLTEFFIKKVASSGTGTLNFSAGLVGDIAGNEFVLKIIVVAVITAIMAVYLKYSKHGYEISVVGESQNTARYIGINTKKVIIRTLVLSGAIGGIVGFLLVSATNHSLSSTSTIGGRGFTGVLVSWLAHFDPLTMVFSAFSVMFIEIGAKQVSDYARLGSSYPNMMTGIFFFLIIASEFFLNYRIIFKHKSKIAKDTDISEEIGNNETAEIESETDTAESVNAAVKEDK